MGLGTTVIGLSVASYMSADSLDEFRIKMRAWTAKTFPKLQVYREMGDTGEQEFADEWDREARKKDWEENAPHAYIGHLIRSNLGPLSRKPEA